MNKHIELVKKWLADKDSVSKEELRENADAAYAAYDAAAAQAAYYAAHDAYYAADAAAAAKATYYAAADAEYWVNKYEDLVDE